MTEHQGGSRPRQSLFAWLPPAAALVVFLYQSRKFCQGGLYFVDDPFISMRFAANLVLHGELSFNPGVRVEGYSNFLHVLIHALTFKLRGGVPDAASGIDGVVSIVFAATLLQALLLGLLSRKSPGRERDGAAWYYAAVLTICSWPFAFWATAGLETPLEGLLYVAILVTCVHPAFGRSGSWALPLLASLLVGVTLLRFEGVIAALGVAAVLGAHLMRAKRRASAISLFATVALASAIYHLWRIAYFGQFLPNTFLAKATGGSTITRLGAGVSYCGTWFGAVGGTIVLAVLALVFARTRRISREDLEKLLDDPVLCVASVLVAIKVALVVWGGGDWMPGWRMLLPVTPAALFLVVRGLLGIVDSDRVDRPGAFPAIVLSAGIVLVAGRGSTAYFPVRDSIPNEGGSFKKLPQGNLRVAEMLEKSFGDGREEVAIGEAGLVPFEALHVKFMDLFGLVDSDMARQPGAMHSRVHVEHVLERGPAAVVFAHLHVLPPYGPYQYGQALLSSASFHERYRRVDLGSELTTLGWALYLRRDVDAAAHDLSWAP
ncbi:MAG TPA: hypothetical protein VMI75_28045 [Polyangiaceae bacterium]|nr:hypothetical protein [Polyangiaceae bacterium]